MSVSISRKEVAGLKDMTIDQLRNNLSEYQGRLVEAQAWNNQKEQTRMWTYINAIEKQIKRITK